MSGLFTKYSYFSRLAFKNLRLSNSAFGNRYYSTEHTLAVRDKIDETRKRALEAGGKSRVEKQHAKVG